MVSFITPTCTLTLLLSLLFISTSVSGHQFEVGGERGWAPPSGNETETYNEWAEQNRFHIGDIIYFKYQDDSVLMVTQEDYESCNGSNPIERFGEDGTAFELDRHGFFYFISGNQDNCEAGQRIIIRVMVQNLYHPSSPAPAPSPLGPTTGGGPGGYDWHMGSGSVAFSSATVVVMSYAITAVSGMLLILYLLMH